MIFQSCPLFSRAITVRKSERKLVGGYYTSLDAIISYFEEHHAFPKEWLEMQAFFEKVFPISCFSLLHDVIVVVFK